MSERGRIDEKRIVINQNKMTKKVNKKSVKNECNKCVTLKRLKKNNSNEALAGEKHKLGMVRIVSLCRRFASNFFPFHIQTLKFLNEAIFFPSSATLLFFFIFSLFFGLRNRNLFFSPLFFCPLSLTKSNFLLLAIIYVFLCRSLLL